MYLDMYIIVVPMTWVTSTCLVRPARPYVAFHLPRHGDERFMSADVQTNMTEHSLAHRVTADPWSLEAKPFPNMLPSRQRRFFVPEQ